MKPRYIADVSAPFPSTNTMMKMPIPPRTFRLFAGLALLAVGVVAARDLDHAATERILPAALRWLIWFGPALGLFGCLCLLRASAWGARFFSRRKVLAGGGVMLGLGVGAWLLALATDHGGDASWANGMMALMAEIYVGIPGLLLMLAALLLKPGDERAGPR